jgi:hypothetical protein
VDPVVGERVREEDVSMAEAVKLGVMCQPPFGEPDMPLLLEALRRLDREMDPVIDQNLRMAATLHLADGELGQLDIGLTHERRDELQLVGTKAVLRFPDPCIGRSRACSFGAAGSRRRSPCRSSRAAPWETTRTPSRARDGVRRLRDR